MASDLRLARDAQDVLDVEIGLDRLLVSAYEIGLVGLRAMEREAVFLRIDRDRAHAELIGGAHDADGDLAPVGDQQAADSLRHGFFTLRCAPLREGGRGIRGRDRH